MASITKLKIPSHHRKDVARLLALSNEQVEALAQALDSAVVTSAADFAASVVIQGLDAEQLESVFDTVDELYGVRNHFGLAVPEFVDALIRAIRDTQDDELLRFDTANSQNNLQKILNAADFSVSVKAKDLIDECERVLTGVRIVTDMRPVYRDGGTDSPKGMLILHTLKLAYDVLGGPEELYLGAAEGALCDLRDAIDRALQKSTSLQTQLSGAGITHLNPTKRAKA